MFCNVVILCYVLSKCQGIAYVESVEDINKVLFNPSIIEVKKFKIE
jgi:hypothetical protein